MFLGGQAVTLEAAAGQTLTVQGQIADQSSFAGTVEIAGPGVVNLAASNSFFGYFALDGGTLRLSAVGAAGSGRSP